MMKYIKLSFKKQDADFNWHGVSLCTDRNHLKTAIEFFLSMPDLFFCLKNAIRHMGNHRFINDVDFCRIS